MRQALVWLRQDLRIEDNTALIHAVEQGFAVLPLYILDLEGEGRWTPGGAGCWWLHQALVSLRKNLQALGSDLWVRSGDSETVLSEMAQALGADAVFWNRRYEPAIMKRDSQIKQALVEDGFEVKSFNASLMWEPHTVSTGQGKAYQVFTPFWKQVKQRSIPEPQALNKEKLSSPNASEVSRGNIDDLGLMPEIQWYAGMETSWEVTEAAAHELLEAFLDAGLKTYHDDRDFPATIGTSRLSPYLHFGLISPRQIWKAVSEKMAAIEHKKDTYLKEVAWREFAYHVMYHFPTTPESPLREKFNAFPWREDAAQLKAWQKGQTGFPIIDAGMRELWHTGWMHNRVRMIVASFLVKNLMISWYEGARWFWDTLVDADLASNTLGWQWAGGCGADAAPYFRIFNPMLQGKKFDPDGAYVRKWCPELSTVPDTYIHEPWKAPENVLEYVGVRLGEGYPHPIVDHFESRDRALAALESCK